MSISPVASYYIRQLINQNRGFLKFVVAPKAGLEAHSLSDMNAVLESLYPETSEALMVAYKLEDLASLHQGLRQGGGMYEEHLKRVEKEIFWLLGFNYVAERVSPGFPAALES